MKGFINLTHTNNGKIQDLKQYVEDYVRVNYATNIDLNIDSSTYVMSVQLKDGDGNPIGNASTVDLPLESVVVSGSYDSLTKEVVLTLESGSEIRFSVADLVSGLQTEITSSNKLSSDYVDDTNKVNKFVTITEKNTWNGKQDSIITGAGAPTVSTEGATNQLYRDTTTNDIYLYDGTSWVKITGLYSHYIVTGQNMNFTIISRQSTAYTLQTITEFLYNAGYTSRSTSYTLGKLSYELFGVSGRFLGVYATSTSSLKFGYQPITKISVDNNEKQVLDSIIEGTVTSITSDTVIAI